jgi:hypothetical protein
VNIISCSDSDGQQETYESENVGVHDLVLFSREMYFHKHEKLLTQQAGEQWAVQLLVPTVGGNLAEGFERLWGHPHDNGWFALAEGTDAHLGVELVVEVLSACDSLLALRMRVYEFEGKQQGMVVVQILCVRFQRCNSSAV